MNLKKYSAFLMAFVLSFSTASLAFAENNGNYNRGTGLTDHTRTTAVDRNGPGIKNDGMTGQESSFNRVETKGASNVDPGYNRSPGATNPGDVRNDDMNLGK